ncbi:MAG: hypothetical protein HND52_12545 [Ignavibacteriae bacterium]|nr:hypothetical protein [Ignavibacteriota bacterium]NOG98780.1 hypothetical protein [Ignavibacteriota bacterium]
MKIFLKILFVNLIAVLLFSCANKTTLTSEEIYSKFGNKYIYDWNIDSTYILAINQKGKISAAHLSPLEYFIYDIQNDSVLIKETLSGGNVKWVSPSLIQVNIVPGNIIDDEGLENLKYKFDIIKNKKITSGE